MLENETNTAALEDTTPQETPSAEQTGAETAEATPQAADGQGEQISSEETEASGPEAFLAIKFNHEDFNLSRDEAVKYAQLGKMYSESGLDINQLKPIYNQLDYVAAQKGKSIEDVVNEMVTADEINHRRELEAKFGDEDSAVIDDLMKVYRDSQKQRYERIVSDRKEAAERAAAEKKTSLENRLASEFAELKQEFPEIADFSSLPKAVKEEASKGRDLLSSYLRFKHSEDKKISEAQKTADEAMKASTGSGGTSESVEDNLITAIMSGLWS